MADYDCAACGRAFSSEFVIIASSNPDDILCLDCCRAAAVILSDLESFLEPRLETGTRRLDSRLFGRGPLFEGQGAPEVEPLQVLHRFVSSLFLLVVGALLWGAAGVGIAVGVLLFLFL